MYFKHLQKICIITMKKEYNFSLLSKARETKNPLHLKSILRLIETKILASNYLHNLQ